MPADGYGALFLGQLFNDVPFNGVLFNSVLPDGVPSNCRPFAGCAFKRPAAPLPD